MIVVTRCQTFRLKCTKFDFGWGSAIDPSGGAGGLLLTGERGGNGRGRDGRKKGGKGKGGEGEGRGKVGLAPRC